jgi:hypothetical protein
MKIKKALLESKWYWFLPIIGMYLLKDIAVWVMSGDTFQIRYGRYNLILCLFVPIQVVSILFVLNRYLPICG